jgi:manganese transport protein
MVSTVLTGPARHRFARVRGALALLGPAFVAAIAYVDPGNVSTNFTAGARYGYLLVWVVVAANAAAGLMQFLSAKLGIATGMSLPEALRGRLPRRARIAYWAQAELVAAATDLAEVLGGAIALNLLFGLPLVLGGVIAGAASLGILAVQDRHGQRAFEQVVVGLLGVIAAGFIAGLFVCRPAGGALAGGLLPRLAGPGSLVPAAGILGATLMPHAVYLHSALARDHPARPGARRPDLIRAAGWDVAAAMLLAGLVNLAMLVVAAAALHGGGGGGGSASGSLTALHAALAVRLGPVIALLFALGLLTSGLAATAVGCYAGAVVMDGLLGRRIPVAVRRIATLLPALVLLGTGIDPTRALVLSQVVLSFGIPFAIIPLTVLTGRRPVMGDAVNGRCTALAAWGVTGAVAALNVALVVMTVGGAA